MDIQEPTLTISNKAVTVWRIHSLLWRGGFLITLAVGVFLSFYFDLPEWVRIGLYIIAGYTLIRLLYKLTIYPLYMQRTWRYAVDSNFIQIKYGFFTKRHVIVPMSRVEYVNTEQGPLLRKFELSYLTIGTLASTHEIPALTTEEAISIRDKIANLAQIDSLTQDNDTNEDRLKIVPEKQFNETEMIDDA